MKKYWKFFIQAINGHGNQYTKGSINKALFLLAIPMVLEMAMEALFAIVDVYFVSQLGSQDAIATIGLTEAFMFIIISLALGISAAATAMVSRRIGEDNPSAAAESGVQAIILTVFMSLVMGVIGWTYAEDLLRLMGGTEALIAQGLPYTRIMLIFNIVLMLLFVNNAIFRGAGDAAISMRTLWIANGLNLVLDPCLIFGIGAFPAMGLEGAAIATCTGRGVGVLYQVWHLVNGRSVIVIGWNNLKLQWEIIKNLTYLSIGGAGQHLLTSASWIFLIRIISHFGSNALAGYTIAIRIIMFTLLPSWGLAMAAATLVGQNLGAGQPERAEQSAWKAAFYNMGFLIVVSIIFFMGSRPLINLFSTDPEVVQNGILALRIICAGYIFYSYEMVLGQAFNGAGDTYTPTILNFVAFWLIQIPLAYYLAIALDYGPIGVYITIAFSSSILAFMMIYVFRKGKWKTVEV